MNTSDTDDFVTWLSICFFALILGPGLLARFVPAAAQLLVKVHILVASNILIPIGTAGLDLPRVLMLAGAVLIVALLLIGSIRHRIRTRTADRRR